MRKSITRIALILLFTVIFATSCDMFGGLFGPVTPDEDMAERIEKSISSDLYRTMFEKDNVEVMVSETTSEDGTVITTYTSKNNSGLAMYTTVASGATFTEQINAATGKEVQTSRYSYLDISGDVSMSVNSEIIKENGTYTTCTVRYDGTLYDMLSYADSLWIEIPVAEPEPAPEE